MARFSSAIALAKKLIDKNGGPTTLRTFPAGVDDPDHPWKPSAKVPVDQTGIQCVFLNYSGKGREAKVYADGTLARIGDKQVYLSCVGLINDPDLNSFLIREDGSIWSIQAADLLDPNGEKIIYELWVRQ